jgi:transporter family protein
MNWLIFALLSAVFAALTSILAKIGIKDINSNLATAVRTTVILVFTWGIAAGQKTLSQLSSISKTSYLFLILSGMATGFSWLFYFRALQLGTASRVVPIDKLSLVITIIFAAIFLKERLTLAIAFGAVLMTAGAIIIAFAK